MILQVSPQFVRVSVAIEIQVRSPGRRRVSLVIESIGCWRIQADDPGMVGPQLPQFLFHRLGGSGLVGQPMQTFEDHSGGAAGQKCRGSLRSGNAAPDVQLNAFTVSAKLVPHCRKQGKDRIGADKSGRLIPLERKTGGVWHRLANLLQFRRRSDDPAQPVRRQFPQTPRHVRRQTEAVHPDGRRRSQPAERFQHCFRQAAFADAIDPIIDRHRRVRQTGQQGRLFQSLRSSQIADYAKSGPASGVGRFGG